MELFLFLLAAATWLWAGVPTFIGERRNGLNVIEAFASAAVWPVTVFRVIKDRNDA